jgi:hypothetical protein
MFAVESLKIIYYYYIESHEKKIFKNITNF